MKCQLCKSLKIYHFNAHSKDLSSVVEENGEYEHDGYFPKVKNICDGDDLDITICLNCGQVQGDFPVSIEEDEDEDDDEWLREEKEFEKEQEARKKIAVFSLKRKHFKENLSGDEETLTELLNPEFVKFLDTKIINYTIDESVGGYGSIITNDDDFQTLLTY